MSAIAAVSTTAETGAGPKSPYERARLNTTSTETVCAKLRPALTVSDPARPPHTASRASQREMALDAVQAVPRLIDDDTRRASILRPQLPLSG
jgi:hypothetical protein